MLEELCKRIQHCCATLRRSRNERNVGSCWFKGLTGFKLCATTPNNMQQGVQTAMTCNIKRSCWPTMLRPFAWDLTLMTAIAFFDVLLAVTILALCLSYNIHVKSTGHILSYMTLNTTFFQQFLLVSHRSENINRIFSG